MGVCIHYRGRLRRPEDIQALTDELADICRSAGWKHSAVSFPGAEPGGLPFRGITFQPHPESESVFMLFQDDGKLAHPFTYSLDGDPVGLPWSWTKTQFAGVDAHIALCRLLHYLEDRWFDYFEVNDETNYYQTGDVREVRRQISTINAGIDALSEGLTQGPPPGEDETLESRISKILEAVWRRPKHE